MSSRSVSLALLLLPLGVLATQTASRNARLYRMRAEVRPRLREVRLMNEEQASEETAHAIAV